MKTKYFKLALLLLTLLCCAPTYAEYEDDDYDCWCDDDDGWDLWDYIDYFEEQGVDVFIFHDEEEFETFATYDLIETIESSLDDYSSNETSDNDNDSNEGSNYQENYDKGYFVGWTVDDFANFINSGEAAEYGIDGRVWDDADDFIKCSDEFYN